MCASRIWRPPDGSVADHKAATFIRLLREPENYGAIAERACAAPNRLGAPFDTARLKRVGLVAIGLAFRADLAVAELSFYRKIVFSPHSEAMNSSRNRLDYLGSAAGMGLPHRIKNQISPFDQANIRLK